MFEKKQSKLTKTYQNHLSSYYQNVLLNQARECTSLITEEKQRYAELTSDF